jgi:hypothetical protein
LNQDGKVLLTLGKVAFFVIMLLELAERFPQRGVSEQNQMGTPL